MLNLLFLKKTLNSKIGRVFKFIISVALVVFLFTTLDFDKVSESLLKINLFYIFLIILILIARNFIVSFRFEALISGRTKLPLLTLLKQYFIAGMFNIFLPSTIGGDGIRVFMLDKEGISKKDSLFFIVIERFIGFVSLIFFAFVGSFFITLPIGLKGLVWLISIVIMGIFAILFFGNLINWSKLKNYIHYTDYIHFLKENKKLLLIVFCWSLLFQLITIYARYLIAISFNISVGFIPFLVFIPLITLFTLIPLSIGGIGFRELAFIYLFGQIGMMEEHSIIISIGSYLLLVVGGVLGFPVYVYEQLYNGFTYRKSESTYS